MKSERLQVGDAFVVVTGGWKGQKGRVLATIRPKVYVEITSVKPRRELWLPESSLGRQA